MMKTQLKRVQKAESQLQPEEKEQVIFKIVYGDLKNPSEIKEIPSNIYLPREGIG